MDKEQLREIKEENKKEFKTKIFLPKQELDPERELPRPGLAANIKKFLTKRNLIILAIIIVVALGGAWVLKKYVFKPAPKKVYQVAVMVRSQHNKDPEEDRKTSLKAGDVLSIQDEDHKWSKTESISYLILKINLTEEQKMKLTSGEEREIKFKELSKEEQDRINEEKKRAKDEDREYIEEPRTETLRAREYYIDLSRKEFEGFNANDLLSGQPYAEEVFDWGVVKKKKSALKEK